MKKELLLASALVSTMGVASVANAVTATMSGAHMTGLQGNDTDAADATIAQDTSSDFSVSLSETTDGGVGIASSFMLSNEGSQLSTAGLTLTFTDGSKLDVIKAGNAAASHDVSVPGSAGLLVYLLFLQTTHKLVLTSSVKQQLLVLSGIQLQTLWLMVLKLVHQSLLTMVLLLQLQLLLKAHGV